MALCRMSCLCILLKTPAMQNKFYPQIQVQEPCQQPWSEMTPEQQGRFCNACARTVIDFTTSSDEELIAFFSTDRTDRVCGRFRPEQLGRPLESARPSRWGWLRTLASLILPVFIHSKSDAQQVHPPAYRTTGDSGSVRVIKRPPVLGIVVKDRIQPEKESPNMKSDVDPRQTGPRKREELKDTGKTKKNLSH